jgi:hypothetical protein
MEHNRPRPMVESEVVAVSPAAFANAAGPDPCARNFRG